LDPITNDWLQYILPGMHGALHLGLGGGRTRVSFFIYYLLKAVPKVIFAVVRKLLTSIT